MTLFTAIKKWLHRMFGKTEEKTVQPVKTKKKLSRAGKKQIEAAIARANRTDKQGKSAQDSIPYERMWTDGICRISDSHYTKTIQLSLIHILQLVLMGQSRIKGGNEVLGGLS